jgi:hypothetical protein
LNTKNKNSCLETAAVFSHAWGIQTLKNENIWYQMVLMVFENLFIVSSSLTALETGTEKQIPDPVKPLLSIQIDPSIIWISFRVRARFTAVKVSLCFDRD